MEISVAESEEQQADKNDSTSGLNGNDEETDSTSGFKDVFPIVPSCSNIIPHSEEEIKLNDEPESSESCIQDVGSKSERNQDKPSEDTVKAQSHINQAQTKPEFNQTKTKPNQAKVKIIQNQPKIKLDQIQSKPKLDASKVAAKSNQFQAKAAAHEAEVKLKIDAASSDNSKGKKRFYFLFRVREYNVITIKKDEFKFKCHVCNGVYKQKFSLKRHFLRNHINPEYISVADISNCKINVSNETIMQQVIEMGKTPSGRKRFKTKDAIFLENNRSRSMPGLYKCHECSEVKVDLESELKAHYVSHPNVQPDENFPCDQCNSVFQKRAVLNKHMAANHGNEDSYNCKKCKLEFSNESEFKAHLSTHGSGRKCKYCEKEFCTPANRKRHENLHEGVRGFSCKHCRLVFGKVEDVKKHVLKNHANLYLTCPHCPKQAFPHIFGSKILLAAHVREKHNGAFVKKIASFYTTAVNNKGHNGKLPASSESSCNICKKKFPDVRAMLKHKNTAHKKALHKHKNVAHKKSVLTKRSNIAAQQKALSKKIEDEKKKNLANKNKVLHIQRTTYERKAKQAVQDKSNKEQLATKKIRLETTRIAVNKFFANLSQNIAENLLENIDGRASQLSIKTYNFIDDQNECLEDRAQRDQIPWSSYNFPNGFDVDLALDKKGREIRPRIADGEQCLYATGLEKVSNAPEKAVDDASCSDSSTDSKPDSVGISDRKPEGALNKFLSLDERKKLLQYEPVVIYICCVCKERFRSYQDFDDHSINNHPNVEVSCMEIEGSKDLPPVVPIDLCRPQYSNPDGVLFSCSVPPPTSEFSILKCTKCYSAFQNSSDFHLHILKCGGIDNLRPRFHKRLNQQKRIKHTMKHRMDLSVKQVPANKDELDKDNNNVIKNDHIDGAKLKYGKDYFSTKNVKTSTPKSPLPFPQTCFFCKQKFENKLLLQDHYHVCANFNRKKKGKTCSPASNSAGKGKSTAKAECSQSSSKSGYSKAKIGSELCSNANLVKSSALTQSGKSQVISPMPNDKIKSGANQVISQSATKSSENSFPREILPKNNDLFHNETNKDHSDATAICAMDLSVKALKQTVENLSSFSKLEANNLPPHMQKKKEKTPIEALHETVRRIEMNGSRIESVNMIMEKNCMQNSKKPSGSSKILGNENTAAPKPVVPNQKQNSLKMKGIVKEVKSTTAPKPILPNPKQNLHEIKEDSDKVKSLTTHKPILPNPDKNLPEIKEGIEKVTNSTALKPILPNPKQNLPEIKEGVEKVKNATALKPILPNPKHSLPQVKEVVNEINKTSTVPKPVLPNSKQNLPKIKEVVKEIKLAASISPNLKKSAAPTLFILSNSDVNKNAIKNINAAVCSIKTKLNEQVQKEPCSELKDKQVIPRRKRKKGQPVKIVQKKAGEVIDSSNFGSDEAICSVKENQDVNQKDAFQSLSMPTDPSPNQNISEQVSADHIVPQISSNELNSIHINAATAAVTNKETEPSPEKPLLTQSTPVSIDAEIPPNTMKGTIQAFTPTESKEDELPTDLFLLGEKANVQFHTSEDRESPTLELLVSSVTQNIKDFDKPTFLDDEKFALPALNINNVTSANCNGANEFSKNSLNFRIIIPEVDSPSSFSASESSVVPESNPSQIDEVSIDVNISPPDNQSNSGRLSAASISDNVTEPSASSEIKSSEVKSISQLEEKAGNDKSLSSIECATDVGDVMPVHQQINLPPSAQNHVQLKSSIPCKTQDHIPVNNDGPGLKALVQNNNFTSTANSAVDPENPSATVKAASSRVNNGSLPSSLTHVPTQKDIVNSGQVLSNNSTEVSEMIPNSVNLGYVESIKKTGHVSASFDSLDEIFKAVIQGNSARRGRKPIKRSAGKPSKLKRNSLSKKSKSPHKNDTAVDSTSSPKGKQPKSKNTKTENSNLKPNKSFELRAFRLEKLEKFNKPVNETLSGKSDHSNSSEVASDFGKDLASRMKERMRLSFGTGSSGNTNEEPCRKVLEDGQSLAQAASKVTSETNINGSLSSSDVTLPSFGSEMYPFLESGAENDFEMNTSIKKECKEPENSKKHVCPFCILEFAYLTNFRRHLKVCRNKFEKLTVETTPSSTSTSLPQHLPKKDEVEESMLNLLRHQSRQNQMIKETQPVKASETEKNFQKFSCESCHKIYFSLFKLMQHRMKEHLMPNAESKAMILDEHSAPDFDEDSLGSPMKEDVETESMSKHLDRAGCGSTSNLIPADTDTDSATNTKCTSIAGKAKESYSKEDNLPPGHEQKDHPKEVSRTPEENVNGTISEMAQKCNDDLQGNMPLDSPNVERLDNKTNLRSPCSSESISETKDVLKTLVSASKHSSDSSSKPKKEKFISVPNKYKELLDPSFLVLPAYGKGRGRKKQKADENGMGKSPSEINEERVEEVMEKKTSTESNEAKVNKNLDDKRRKSCAENNEGKGKEIIEKKQLVSENPKEDSVNELQSKREIYLKILENCSKLSIIKNTPTKDTSKLKTPAEKVQKKNMPKQTNSVQRSITNIESSPANFKKRGRKPKLTSNVNLGKKKDITMNTDLVEETDIDVYTVSSEENNKKITVIKEASIQRFTSFASKKNYIPKRGRKRAVIDAVPKLGALKGKRKKYAEMDQLATESLSFDTESEIKINKNALPTISRSEKNMAGFPPSLKHNTSSKVMKLNSSKIESVAKSINSHQNKGFKGKQSAITKFKAAMSSNSLIKVSKSTTAASTSIDIPAVESSLTSNSFNSKVKGSKPSKSFVDSSCDNQPGPSTSFNRGTPKNSRTFHFIVDTGSSPDDLSDFQPIRLSKKRVNKNCPICKKKFPASLLRNRHVQLVHGRKNNRIDEELPPPVPLKEEKKLKKQLDTVKSRAMFQRHCIKPLPPMKRKYKKLSNNIARMKKQKL